MPKQPDHHPDQNDRVFDGIICFGGEDWWYHNRGHYDMRMMRAFSQSAPVLYVNSIGMRTPTPREGAMFAKRVLRKLESVRRGFVRLTRRFGVLTPLSAPGRIGAGLTRGIVERQVRYAAHRMGIARPLVWVACPAARPLVDSLNPQVLVYQRTDRYECFPGVPRRRIAALDRELKARADLTVFCGDVLYRRESTGCRHACLIDHGVEAYRFASAADGELTEPADVATIAHPRVGFIGGIDEHTFDAGLFSDVVRAMPDVQFILVGACSLSDRWRNLENVHHLGQQPLSTVPSYMAACDALIMPWRQNEWIDACNPVKLKEYLATGRPIVSTPFEQLRRYGDLVQTARDAGEFVTEVRLALNANRSDVVRRRRAAGSGWTEAAGNVLAELSAIGVTAARTPEKTVPRQATLRLAQGLSPVRHRVSVGAHPGAMRRPRSCIMLAGGLEPSPLVQASGRSVLDLFLTPDQTVLDVWMESVNGGVTDDRLIEMRVVSNAFIPSVWPRSSSHVRFEEDPLPYRGPAGILLDMCAGYSPDDHVMVVEAGRVCPESLTRFTAAHFASEADITIARNPDESPAGVYMVRCRALKSIAPVGYVDLKEQWLARSCAAGSVIRVVDFAWPGALPLRTRTDFLHAARCLSRRAPSIEPSTVIPSQGSEASRDGSLRIIGRGATVASDADVYDAVVMPGATVGAAAYIEQSIICPGAVIEPRARIIEAIVSTAGCCVDDRPHAATHLESWWQRRHTAHAA